MKNLIDLIIYNSKLAATLFLLVSITGCSLFDNDISGNLDPGPIAPPYDIEIKQMDRKDYLVCCGDTLSAKSEFFFDDQNRFTKYEFFNFDNINTLFNTYSYSDEGDQVDIIKRFITQTDTGVPALTDSIRHTYNDAGQLIEITNYFAPNDSTISSSTVLNSYDENGRLKLIFRSDLKTEFFYDERGNMSKKELSIMNQETGQFELSFFRTYRYGDIKNPFFRKHLLGVVFVFDLNRSLSPYAPVEINNFNTETDDPVAGATLEYEVNADGFPTASRLIFKNFDGVSQGTVVETQFTYLDQ